MRKNIIEGKHTKMLIVALFVIFLATAIIFKVFSIEIFPSQFYGAMIGVVITALITMLLLEGQTQKEEDREKSLKIFEKKQEVYHNFLEFIKRISEDGKITTANDVNQPDELKELFFQLGIIQMHTSLENTQKVFEHVADIISTINNELSNAENQQQNKFSTFYGKLSEKILKLSLVLKDDLYDKGKEESNESSYSELINSILREADISEFNQEYDKIELQMNFWNELKSQLKEKGYVILEKDFRKDVEEYYARARNRHRYYSLEFEILKLKNGIPVLFSIEIENAYYYGFPRNETYNEIENFIPVGFKKAAKWFGWRFPKKENNIDFWKQNDNFKKLNDKEKRKDLIKNIIIEIEGYIFKFKDSYLKHN